jgi:transposase
MVYVRPLAEAERQELKRLARREVGRVSERMRAVLLSGRGYSVPEIARIFECDEATVREWIRRFEAEGVAGLRDRPKSGRRPRATPAARETLRRAVTTERPAQGSWTVVLLQVQLVVTTGVRVSRTTVRRLLVALGFRWRRPKLALPTDPEAPRIMWTLCERLLAAPAGAAILALDECDVHLVPVLRGMWMPRGEQAAIPTPGTNQKRGVFGALELEGPSSGAWHYQVTARKRVVEFLAFVEQLVAAYPGRPLWLVLDNAGIHTAKRVREWLALHPAVELLFLPRYSGHRQNPVEKVWWRLKQQVAANRLHGSIEALETAVHQFCAELTPQATLKLAA